ncbi:serpin I2-like [Uranotaenia lowii]|uniref:serpin I2-like n=1 Tax=Uranotaenia lowii TaxID=190385 RepID=UPI002478C48A|nr:serpin I2-like [Uranotaenia lowii]
MFPNAITLASIASLLVSMASASSDANLKETDDQGEFSWRFLEKASNEYKDNIVVSSYSVRRLIASLLRVTEQSDEVTNELQNVLNLSIDSKISQRYNEQMERLTGSGDLIKGSLLAVFRVNKLSDDLQAEATRYGLKVVQTEDKTTALTAINNAINEMSKGKVEEFTKGYDFRSLSMMDYIEYNGLWKYNFNGDPTVCNFFTDASTTTLTNFITAETMFNYGSFENLNLKALELPLPETSALRCVLLLPLNKKSLQSVMQNFDHNNFREILKGLSSVQTSVTIPKFVMQLTTLAKNVLETMGLHKPFTNAIFNVYQNGQENLDEIVQKSKFTMNGNGTTNPRSVFSYSMMQQQQFFANQPFIYVIFEKVQSIPILMGHYERPTEILPEGVQQSEAFRCQLSPF